MPAIGGDRCPTDVSLNYLKAGACTTWLPDFLHGADAAFGSVERVTLADAKSSLYSHSFAWGPILYPWG